MKRRRILLGGLALVLVLAAAGRWVRPTVCTAGPDGADRRVSAGRLRAHVQTLAQTFFPRDAEHPGNLDRAAAYVAAEFEKAGGRVTAQPYTVASQRYQNVLASFGPEAGGRIVVGAHYDSFGPLPATDDNASGVAGLIELAGLLGEPAPPALRVDLVAYTLEEPPYFRRSSMGSWVHANALRQASVPVRVMLALEMIGYFTDVPKSQDFPYALLRLFYPSRGNFIAVIGRWSDRAVVGRVKAAMQAGSDLPVSSLTGPRFVPGVDFSDHLNYWLHGYPAVMITDTAFYRNHRYHTEHDTPDTLDYVRMARVVEGVHRAVRAVAKD